MYTTLKLLYKDGTKQKLVTEPMGRDMAKELMNYVFYQESDDAGDGQIISAWYYSDGKEKTLSIHRESL